MYQKYYDECNTGNQRISRSFFSRGGKILFAYVCLEYIFPLLLNIIFSPVSLFKLPIASPEVMFSLVIVIFVFILAISMASISTAIVPVRATPIKPIPRWALVIFFVLCAGLGAYLLLQGQAKWRYGSTGISDRGGIFFLVAVLQALLPVVCFWILMTDHTLLLSKKFLDYIIKLLIIMALLFSINGFGGVMVAMFFIVILLRPVFSLGMLFSSHIVGVKRNFMAGKVMPLLLISFLLIPLSIAGLFVKQGDLSVDTLADEYGSIDYWINRHSVHLAIAAASIDDESNYENLYIPMRSFWYRVRLLTGQDVLGDKPVIGSISRLTVIKYAEFDITRHPRMGASPGLVASFTLFFPFLVSMLMLFVFVFSLIKVIDYLLSRQPHFSWIGAFCFAYLSFRYVTDSPLDLIVPGPALLAVLLPVIMACRREKVM